MSFTAERNPLRQLGRKEDFKPEEPRHISPHPSNQFCSWGTDPWTLQEHRGRTTEPQQKRLHMCNHQGNAHWCQRNLHSCTESHTISSVIIQEKEIKSCFLPGKATGVFHLLTCCKCLQGSCFDLLWMTGSTGTDTFRYNYYSSQAHTPRTAAKSTTAQ